MRPLFFALFLSFVTSSAHGQGYLRNDDGISHTSGITINEVSARSATDFNGDGATSTANDKDEFVEIINTADIAIDVNGWEIADNNNVFSFTGLQPIEPDHALIVFTRGADVSNFDPGPGNQVISVTDLALHNEQDVVGIKNLQSVIVGVEWVTSTREQFPSGWAVGLLAGYIGPLPMPWNTGQSKVRVHGTDYAWENHPEVPGTFTWSVNGAVSIDNPSASPGRTNQATALDVNPVELPQTAVLLPAYPNPFNPTTTVTYGLPAASEVRITATDLLGRQVATLVAGDMKAAGYHTVQFNADGLASGTYLIRMEAGDFVATQQLVLLK